MKKPFVVFVLAMLLVPAIGAFAAEPGKTLQTQYGKLTIIGRDPRIIVAPDPIRDGFSLYPGLPQLAA